MSEAGRPAETAHPEQRGNVQLRRFTLALALAWTILALVTTWWMARSSLQTAESHAVAVAKALLDKDLVYRRWAAGHGGVYAPVTADNPPNPDLADIPERDLTTPSGRQLTLINPAYMTRQVHELGARDYGERGHITSLKPLRAANAPDAWERESLLRFAAGGKETTSVVHEQGVSLLRHMRVLITEAKCLKCHEAQGYRVGDVRGGISVSVPLDQYQTAAWADIRLNSILHACLWLAGMATLAFGYRSLSRSIGAGRSIQRQFQDLVETSHDLIWQLDREGRMVYLNPAWELALGHPVAELIGRPFSDIKDPGDMERGLAAFRGMVDQGGAILSQESVFLHRDGHQVHLIINAKAIHDQDGRVAGCRGTAFDNTERRALEERLRQSEKMLAVGQLAGGIAHDFNNQLAGILGYAELLHQRLEDPVARRYSERIATAAQRSADLTSKLLAFARKGHVLSIPVDLHACIHETQALLARSIDRRIAIREELTAPAAWVRGDPTLIQNALLNLGINARDAMPEGGTLTFASSARDLTDGEVPDLPAGSYIELRVIDTGFGMDEQVRKHLFEPFFTTKGPGKGTGMGLAAVFGTVTGHGGRIHVDSSPGKGSCFRILLPLYRIDAQTEAAPSPCVPTIPRLRILVVDDEPVVNELLREILREDGHQVMSATDGLQALETFRAHQHDIDLVILDLMMPGMDGRHCFHELRRIAPTLKVLVASGFSAGGAQGLIADGATGFIQKPFQRDRLRQALAAAYAPQT